jgi:hypothetical protein
MTNTRAKDDYRPTESKFKGGASEMFVTYDLAQRTRGGGSATYPKVKRVYIAGKITDRKFGHRPEEDRQAGPRGPHRV